MKNWDKYRRMQCNINKAILNEAVTSLMITHYKQLSDELVLTPEDKDVFNDTYLKLTYKYNPNKDFKEQFRWVFNQLKGAYFRDDRSSHYYTLNEDRLTIPDFIPDYKTDGDIDIVEKLKTFIKSPCK